MKRFALIPLAALAVTGCTYGASEAPEEMSATAQTRLADELRGYSAGRTMPCVSQRDLRGNRSVGEEALIFEGRGSTIYVNRPPGGCPELKFNRALITQTFSDRLCRGDITRVFDPTSGVEYGGCGLGDFTEYRRNPR